MDADAGEKRAGARAVGSGGKVGGGVGNGDAAGAKCGGGAGAGPEEEEDEEEEEEEEDDGIVEIKKPKRGELLLSASSLGGG